MKDFIFIFIIFLLGAFLILKTCAPEKPKPPDNSREIELLQKIEQLGVRDSLLMVENDSLRNLRSQIVTSIIYRDREIDEQIAKDSTKAIVEYRRSLEDNNELPSGTETLSYREIGIGAKLMAKVPKLELTIDIQDSIIFNQEIIISDKDYTIDSYKQVCEIKDLSTQYWMEMYKDESSFWNSKELWFGVGVLVSVGIVFASGALK